MDTNIANEKSRKLASSNFDAFVPSTKVAVTDIGNLRISTVKLNTKLMLDDQDWPYETCIFYTNGTSNVVAEYFTKEEALLNHSKLVHHEIQHIIAREKIQVVPKLI